MLIKCTDCHHEWQAILVSEITNDLADPMTCCWCGAPGEILSDEDELTLYANWRTLKNTLEELYGGDYGKEKT